MELSLLKEGAIIMAIGMGTVFFFLIIMIAVMNLSEKVLRFVGKYFPEESSEMNVAKKSIVSNDAEIALAIACAVHKAQKI